MLGSSWQHLKSTNLAVSKIIFPSANTGTTANIASDYDVPRQDTRLSKFVKMNTWLLVCAYDMSTFVKSVTSKPEKLLRRK